MAGSYNKRKVFTPPYKGLNDKFVAPLLSESDAAELTNCAVNERGLLEKYKGYISDGSPFPNDPDSPIRMLINYRRGTYVDKLVMGSLDNANTNTKLKVDFKET